MMKRAPGILIILIMISIPVPAFQWPLEEPRVIRSFGMNYMDDFYTGVLMESSKNTVRPIADGELLYYHREAENTSGMPAGMGNMMVLQHEREIRSVYGNLIISENITDNYRAVMTEPVGLIGSEIPGAGTRLFLKIIDTEVSHIVNPLVSLPLLPASAAVVIESVYAYRIPGGERVVLTDTMRIQSGEYRFAVELGMQTNGNRPVSAPFSLSLYINGTELRNISFNAFKVESGKVFLTGTRKLAFDEIYITGREYLLGTQTLLQGNVQLEIQVQDHSGREAVRRFRITVGA